MTTHTLLGQPVTPESHPALFDGCTKQQVFDHVVRHLGGMRKQCAVNSKCRYRLTVDGGRQLACAVGALFRDDECDTSVALSTSAIYVLYQAGRVPRRFAAMLGLLTRLQAVHDNPYPWGARGFVCWHTLSDIADTHGLTLTDPINSQESSQ